MVETAHYSVKAEEILTSNGGRLWIGESGGFVGSEAVLRNVSLASLRAAALRSGYYLGNEDEVPFQPYDVDEGPLGADEDAFIAPAYDITFVPKATLVNVPLFTDVDYRFSKDVLLHHLAPALRRHRLRVWEATFWREAVYGVIHLTCEIKGRGATVGDAIDAAINLDALWRATSGGGLTVTTAADLIRNGHPELLIDQPENVWLEVKGEPYVMKHEGQKFELAKDVAALGNTADGGLLVLGLSTSKQRGIDTISDVRPIPSSMISPESYRDTINDRVFPPPNGLGVDFIEIEAGKGLLLISVPRQPPENLPLIVFGALIDGKVNSAHALIPTRVGDKTINTHAASIHSLIVAGRAALARDFAHRREAGYVETSGGPSPSSEG